MIVLINGTNLIFTTRLRSSLPGWRWVCLVSGPFEGDILGVGIPKRYTPSPVHLHQCWHLVVVTEAGGTHSTGIIYCLCIHEVFTPIISSYLYWSYIYRPQTKFGQGNIFSCVCQEFCSQGEGICLSACWDTTPPPEQTPSPGAGTHPRRSACWEIRSTSGRYASLTGMQSCQLCNTTANPFFYLN